MNGGPEHCIHFKVSERVAIQGSVEDLDCMLVPLLNNNSKTRNEPYKFGAELQISFGVSLQVRYREEFWSKFGNFCQCSSLTIAFPVVKFCQCMSSWFSKLPTFYRLALHCLRCHGCRLASCSCIGFSRSCRASFTTSSQVSLTHWLTGLRLCELAVKFTLFSGKEELHRLGADLRITAQVGLVWLGPYNSAGSVLLSSWDLTAHQPIAHTWST